MDPQPFLVHGEQSQIVNNPTSKTGCLTERTPLTPYDLGLHHHVDPSFLSCFRPPPLPHLPTFTHPSSKGWVVLDSLPPENEESYAKGWYSGCIESEEPYSQVSDVGYIRNKATDQSEGLGFIESKSHAAADEHQDDSYEFSVYVSNLAAEVTDYLLEKTFKAYYPSVKGARVATDGINGRCKGYGFVYFADEDEMMRSLTEMMNRCCCLSRKMFIRLATNTGPASIPKDEHRDESHEFSIFVANLAAEVTDYLLEQTFKEYCTSVKGARVVTDGTTGRSKGYGFVSFADKDEMMRSLTEMDRRCCLKRPMFIGPASTGPASIPKAIFQRTPAVIRVDNPTTVASSDSLEPRRVFVGGLDSDVTEENLRQVFSLYGELSHVKIHVGKNSGVVEFNDSSCAERAISSLHGSQLGGSKIRLSWACSPAIEQGVPLGMDRQWPAANMYRYNGSYADYGYFVADMFSFQGCGGDPKAGRRFRFGKVENKNVVMVMTGLGMLNAGIATELLLNLFKVESVLHFGIAGNADSNLHVGDVVIPKYWAHTGLWNWQRFGDGPNNELALQSNGDYARKFGYLKFSDYKTQNNTKAENSTASENLLNNVWYQPEEIFPIDGTPEVRQHAFWVPVDGKYYELAKKLEGMKLEGCVNSTCLQRPPQVVRVARGCSADIFVDNAAYREFLHSKFNVTPLDMESSAVALVCLQHKTPFITIRALSDLAGGGSAESNEADVFASLAAENAVKVLVKFITLLS